MHVVFMTSDKPRERILAEAFTQGIKSHGDTFEVHALQPEPVVYAKADVVCMVGVKSKELFRAHVRAGTHVVMLDKGYTRHSVSGAVRAWEYWRVAVDAHHPTHYLSKVDHPTDRLERLRVEFAPWRKSGKHIVLAGSSAKYHAFYDLPDPTKYAQKMIRRIAGQSQREVLYRPKPSWKEAVPIFGSTYSTGGSISDVLVGAHALVTHGSNACFEAVLAGVPCVITGDAVAKPISSVDVEEIENPRLASDAERTQWLANLSYAQWTMREMASGEAWQYIRPEIYG